MSQHPTNEEIALGAIYDKALERGEGYAPARGTRDHLFTVDSCGGDAELICVLQKAMEQADKVFGEQRADKAAVAEWFYAKYGKP